MRWCCCLRDLRIVGCRAVIVDGEPLHCRMPCHEVVLLSSRPTAPGLQANPGATSSTTTAPGLQAQPGGAVYRPPLWGATSSARARVHQHYQSP